MVGDTYLQRGREVRQRVLRVREQHHAPLVVQKGAQPLREWWRQAVRGDVPATIVSP